MPDESAFFQSIAADPDADGPRLRYADYLDEKGDAASAARAEFIRVQCALAAAGPTDPVGPDLAARERALLSTHWPEWLKPACQALAEPTPIAMTRAPGERAGASDRYSLSWGPAATHMIEQREGTDLPYFHSGQFRRGFLAHVALNHKTSRSFRLASHVARLFDKAPVDGLTLVGYPTPDVGQTLAAISGDRLRTLELVHSGPDAVVAVAARPALTGLRELAVWSRGRTELATIGALSGLRSLILHVTAAHATDFVRLGQGPLGRQLERMEIVGEGPNAATAEAIARGFPSDHRLKYLGLGTAFLTTQTKYRLQARFGAACDFDPPISHWPVRYYR